jgi:hypothetical protein
MLLVSGTPDDPEDDPVMETQGAKASYYTVKSSMHESQTEENKHCQIAGQRIIEIANLRTIQMRWSKSKLVNAQLHVRIPKESTHRVDHKWTENE